MTTTITYALRLKHRLKVKEVEFMSLNYTCQVMIMIEKSCRLCLETIII